MKKILYLTFFVPLIAHSKTFLNCEFSQWTDLDDGQTYTKEYYQKEYPTQKSLYIQSVYLEVFKSEKKVRFYPNDNLYSVFITSIENGDGVYHNGKSDGNYHEINYSETGNLIEWSFIKSPKFDPLIWRHSLDRYGGNLKIATRFWTKEYECKKSDSLF